MNETQLNAYVTTLKAQRNTALDGVVQSESQLAVAREVIDVQQKQIDELKAKNVTLQAQVDAQAAVS